MKKFVRYVSFNILGMIAISCYILADTFFISKALKSDGLTALNIAIPVFSFISAVGLMLGIGGGSKYTTLRARGEIDKSNSVFTGVFCLGVLIGILFLLVGVFFARPLATVLGAKGNIVDVTVLYLSIIMYFAPFFIINNILTAFVRNDGAPLLSMMAVITGSLANIVLDYVFIFPLKLGMTGAAIATGFSPVISIIILSVHFIRRKSNFRFKFSKEITAVFLALPLGVSSFVTEASSGVVIIILNLQILKIAGNIGVAAYGIITNISLVAISVFTGIGQGIQPIVSEGYGKGDVIECSKTIKRAAILSLILSLMIYSVCALFSEGLISIFNEDNNIELVNIAQNGIYIYFSGLIFAAKNIVYAAYLSALNRSQSAFWISLTRGCLAIIPLSIILPYILQLNGVWLSFVLAEFVAFLIVAVNFIKSKRKKNNDNKNHLILN